MEERLFGLSPSQWTAIGTIGLLIVTAIYVVLTGKVARAARQSATSAAQSAEAAERLLLLELVPLMTLRRIQTTSGSRSARISPNVENIGRSPAFNVHLTVEGRGIEKSWHLADVVNAGDAVSPGIEVDRQHYDAISAGVSATVVFEDAVGNKYRFLPTSRDGRVETERLVDGMWKPLVSG